VVISAAARFLLFLSAGYALGNGPGWIPWEGAIGAVTAGALAISGQWYQRGGCTAR